MKDPYAEVLILGGGFAGFNVAKCLGSTGRDVVLIDRTNHHLFQPLLYQVATAGIGATDIAYPIRELLKKHENISVLMAEAVSIDRHARRVLLADGSRYTFDYLVVAVGVEVNFFDKPDWARYALPLKTLDDAIKIRDRLLLSYEKAEMSEDPAEVEKLLTYVVIGGGSAGIEIAGAIAEIANKTLLKNFRRIHSSRTRVCLLESHERIAGEFSDKLAQKAEEGLKKLGVTVIKGVSVTDIDENGVAFKGGRIEASNVIWAAGMKAPETLKSLDTRLHASGRVMVRPDLSIHEDERIFVIGDASSVEGAEGPLPGTAPVAIQEAAHVCGIIKNRMESRRRGDFSYLDKGMLATIGKKLAIARIGKFEFSGFLAWVLWSFVHILYLICFKNRIAVFISWVYYYFTGKRGARIIHSNKGRTRN